MKLSNRAKSLSDIVSVGKRILSTAVSVRPAAVALYLFGAILETAASIVTIFASAKLAGLLATYITTKATDGIWFWLYVDIASAVAIGIGFWIMRYSERLLYFAMNKWAVNAFMTTMGRIDIAAFYDDEMRNKINKADSGYSWQMPNLSVIYLELIYALIRFSAIAVVVAQISPWLIFVIAIFLLPTLFSDAKIASIQWMVWGSKGDNRHIFSRLGQMLAQPKQQMELRSMQAQQYAQNKIKTINTEFYREQETKFRSASKLSFSSKVLEVGGVAIGSIILLRQFLGGSLALDRYFFLSGALLRIGGALNAIFGSLSRLQDPMLFAQNFYELIDAKPAIKDTVNAVELKNAKPPTIEFKSVSFTYPGQTVPTFSNLNVKIDTSEHVALVGENGAGKSTLIKLLLRFYIPDSGTILIDGKDLNEISIDSWYKQLATLFQDFNEYPFPIDENIYIGKPGTKPDKAKLQQAAEFGGVDELIKDYKHGWETVLDASFKKGIEPSGGQWQRVALARAFYRDANILILDEPTSAIDAKAEYDIFNNIFDHYQSKSALIISHRFSTVRRANRIIVLEHGNIMEQGSHAELMKAKGLYHELFSKQAEGYQN